MWRLQSGQVLRTSQQNEQQHRKASFINFCCTPCNFRKNRDLILSLKRSQQCWTFGWFEKKVALRRSTNNCSLRIVRTMITIFCSAPQFALFTVFLCCEMTKQSCLLQIKFATVASMVFHVFYFIRCQSCPSRTRIETSTNKLNGLKRSKRNPNDCQLV